MVFTVVMIVVSMRMKWRSTPTSTVSYSLVFVTTLFRWLISIGVWLWRRAIPFPVITPILLVIGITLIPNQWTTGSWFGTTPPFIKRRFFKSFLRTWSMAYDRCNRFELIFWRHVLWLGFRHRRDRSRVRAHFWPIRRRSVFSETQLFCSQFCVFVVFTQLFDNWLQLLLICFRTRIQL